MKYYEEGRTYCPGDFTEPENRHESYETLRDQIRPLLPDKDSDRIVKPDHYCIHEHCVRPIDESCPPQIANAIENFEIAKQFHKENLEHHPLPETVTDRNYRKLQLERKRNPGLALENEPFATGVGYKGYGAPGPTQCTKMKVYRPKTCTMSKEIQFLENDSKCRPSTARIIQLKEVTPMQLALCWDVIPENPKDEPKLPTHIDGSNGSAAPAVFTMVYSPKPNKNQETDTGEDQHYLVPSCNNPDHNAGSVFNKREDRPERTSSSKPRTREEFFRFGSKYKHENEICCHVKQMKISEDTNNNTDHGKNLNRNSAEAHQNSKANRPSTYHNRPQTSASNSTISISGDKSKLLPREKITPNKFLNRPCMACEMKGRLEETRVKPEYKSAFKAGKPNSVGSNSNSSGDSSNFSPGKVQIHVPKQRNPYAKRNYQIGTLAPPFSLRPGKHGCDYPEHWRLASIYQHSYKPLELRKRPLLTNVYL